MTIQTKFNIGDLVAFNYEYDKFESIPCKECQGKGKIIVVYKENSQLEVTCPMCSGNKHLETRKKESTVEEHTINRIMYDSSPWINTDFIHYGFEGHLIHQPNWNIFSESKCTLVKTAEHLHEE